MASLGLYAYKLALSGAIGVESDSMIGLNIKVGKQRMGCICAEPIDLYPLTYKNSNAG